MRISLPARASRGVAAAKTFNNRKRAARPRSTAACCIRTRVVIDFLRGFEFSRYLYERHAFPLNVFTTPRKRRESSGEYREKTFFYIYVRTALEVIP